jgi:hypothetical protein
VNLKNPEDLKRLSDQASEALKDPRLPNPVRRALGEISIQAEKAGHLLEFMNKERS